MKKKSVSSACRAFYKQGFKDNNSFLENDLEDFLRDGFIKLYFFRKNTLYEKEIEGTTLR